MHIYIYISTTYNNAVQETCLRRTKVERLNVLAARLSRYRTGFVVAQPPTEGKVVARRGVGI